VIHDDTRHLRGRDRIRIGTRALALCRLWLHFRGQRLTLTNWDVTRRPRDGHVPRPSPPPPRRFGDSFAVNSLRRWHESVARIGCRASLDYVRVVRIGRRSRDDEPETASVSPDDSAPSSIRGLEIERFEEDPRCRYPTALCRSERPWRML